MLRPADASVTIIGQNEAPHIGACLASVARAGQGLRLAVDVVVNGSTDGSAWVAVQASRALGLAARVFAIPYGDKANAINQAVHVLRPAAGLHVFVDAYAVLAEPAIHALRDTLAGNPRAMAVTGLAGNGRTMRQAAADTLREGGRINGQLHAFRPEFLDRMVAAGMRLPVGLYRGDSLLASMACHDLDACGQPWDNGRVLGAAGAVFFIPGLSPLRPRDYVRQYNRRVRQARGLMENAAIKSVIYTRGYAGLPGDADEMIAAWLAGGGVVRAGWVERGFLALSLRRHLRARRPGASELLAVAV